MKIVLIPYLHFYKETNFTKILIFLRFPPKSVHPIPAFYFSLYTFFTQTTKDSLYDYSCLCFCLCFVFVF